MSRNTPWRTSNKMWSLRQQKNDWYRIRNQVDGPTQLYIYDEIGYFGVSAGDLIRDLADVNGPLEVHLNSPGGEVFDGIAIYNTLLARHDVTMKIDGLAASIASVIAMAGNPVEIARNGQMMVHDGFGMAIGTAQDMRDLAELLDRTSNNIAGIYSDHTGRPVAYWREIMKAETWYSSDESVDVGLADRIMDSGAGRQVTVNPEDKWDLSVFRRNATQNAASGPHGPHQGRHSHPHDAFGSQGEDKEHDHEHEHSGGDGHDHHGQQDHGDPLRNAAVDNSAWDAAKAWAAGTASDNPAAFFAAICAGRKAGDKNTQAAWALPHHYSPGPPNAAGVRAALARLPQTDGLTNAGAARSHLESHMKDINPDWTPSGQLADPTYGLSDDEIKAFAASLRL
jgi:ATP-dependent protease ClpP protease subunit